MSRQLAPQCTCSTAACGTPTTSQTHAVHLGVIPLELFPPEDLVSAGLRFVVCVQWLAPEVAGMQATPRTHLDRLVHRIWKT